METNLRPWLARAGREYRKRKSAAEKIVVRWEHATKEDRSVEPLYFERHDFGRGKRLAALPKPPKLGNMSYGLDAAGRTVVERSYVLRGSFNERFITWFDGEYEWVYYSYDHSPVGVCRGTLDDEGRIVAYSSAGTGGAWVKRFTYQPDGKVLVDERYANPNGSPGGKSSEVVETKPAKEPPLADLLPPLEERLIAEIPKRVRALRVKEPACSLIVAFAGKGNDMFPPTLGVGLERERQALAARTDLDLAEVLWDVADYEHYLGPALDLKASTKALAPAVNRGIARRDAWSAGYKSYARIAAALRKLDWKKVLPTTADFVIIAVDYDDTGLMRALKEAAGPKTFAAWKKKKWVR